MRYLITLTLMGFSSLAYAGTPNWTGFAGLADADKDGWPAFVGTSTAASTGYDGEIDCDDGKGYKNPGATEIVGDGIDQDCSGHDLVLPVGDAAWKRFIAKEYRGRTPSAKTFVAEFDRVTAASTRASVDSEDGRFVVKDPKKDVFCDVYRGDSNSKLLIPDGIREVVTIEEASHSQAGLVCITGKPSSSSSSGGSGPSIAIVKKIAADAAAKVAKAEKEERLAAQVIFQTGVIDPLTDTVNEHIVAIKTTTDALEAEIVRAKKAELIIDDKAKDAQRAADESLSRKTFVEVFAVAGFLAGSPVQDGQDTARKPIGGGVGAGISLGLLDTDSGRVGIFVDGIIGADGGDGPMHAEKIGIDLVGLNGVGFSGAYGSRTSQADVLATEVRGQSGLGGVTYVKTFSEEDNGNHGVFQARVLGGPEWIAMAGESRNTSGVGFTALGTISVGWGRSQ
jgi:hypothetical protein